MLFDTMHSHKSIIRNITSGVRSTMNGRVTDTRMRLILCLTLYILTLPVLSKTSNSAIQSPSLGEGLGVV